jgi:hypothetical protein
MKTNRIIQGDALQELQKLPDAVAQAIIADPPYFNVLEDEAWDTQWKTAADYLAWCEAWVAESMRVLRDDGLAFIFGQLGKREHTFLHLMSRLTQQHQFHDLIIWDRAVGYDERRDSFTPQYEMVLVLRKGDEGEVQQGRRAHSLRCQNHRDLPQRQALQGHGRAPRPSRSRQVRHQHPPRAQLEGQLEGKVRPPIAEAHRPHRKAHRLLHGRGRSRHRSLPRLRHHRRRCQESPAQVARHRKRLQLHPRFPSNVSSRAKH